MVNIIMNEREWCEDALENPGTKGDYEAISRLAKYYYSLGFKRADVSRRLEDYLLCCDPHASIVKWQNSIDRCLDNMDKHPLIDIPFVPVTQSELDTIDGLQNIVDQKVLFTLVCLTKYLNAVDHRNNDWCRFETRDIFALANIILNVRRRSAVLTRFKDAGLITFSKIVDNTSVHTEIIDHTGDPVMRITDFRNLGFQYMATRHDGYMCCEICGIVMKRRSPAQKYCPACAVDIDSMHRVTRYMNTFDDVV